VDENDNLKEVCFVEGKTISDLTTEYIALESKHKVLDANRRKVERKLKTIRLTAPAEQLQRKVQAQEQVLSQIEAEIEEINKQIQNKAQQVAEASVNYHGCKERHKQAMKRISEERRARKEAETGEQSEEEGEEEFDNIPEYVPFKRRK